MFFTNFYRSLKPLNIQSFVRKYGLPAQCPPNKSESTKKIYDEPNCKKVIIVGGTGDIGFATANHLLCAKAKQIAILDMDMCKGDKAVSALTCTFGRDKAIFVKADVTEKMGLHDSMRKAKSELKHVDMIINAFGIWNEKQWEQEIKINLIGCLNVQEIAEDIVNKPGGFILNLAGLAGIEPFSPTPILAAAFHGIVGYTRSKGHERNFAHTGVRQVALCVGITESFFAKDIINNMCCPQMTSDLKAYLSEACWQKPEAVAKAVIEVYRHGAPGTVWIVEGSRLFSLTWPDMNKFRVLENQFI